MVHRKVLQPSTMTSSSLASLLALKYDHSFINFHCFNRPPFLFFPSQSIAFHLSCLENRMKSRLPVLVCNFQAFVSAVCYESQMCLKIMLRKMQRCCYLYFKKTCYDFIDAVNECSVKELF